jgi:hypothetical protein
MPMFSIEDRNRVRDRALALASSDERVVAGAVVGSLALDEGDRWSDLDLTFGVAEGVLLSDVLDDWTRSFVAEFDAVQLFDLLAGATIYRVFLLPGCLQFDLSFSPASEFAALGPKFRLLFGSTVERPFPGPPAAEQLFGYAVHHVLRARFCIERGRFWHAEYWISAARDHALSLACRRLGLPAYYGRGFDDLPEDVRGAYWNALVRSLDRDALLRTLRETIAGLLRESDEVRALAVKLEPQLQRLAASQL